MATNVSPGVYTKIIDLTAYLADIPGTIGFIPFFTRQGPDNQLTFITSLQELADTYGRPNINDFGRAFGQGYYIAWNHVSTSPSFYCLRCLPDDAAFSNLFVVYNSDSTGSIEVTHATSQNSLLELETTLQQVIGTEYPLAVFYPVGRGDFYDDFAITIARSANLFKNSSVDGVEATPTEAVYDIDIWKTQSDGDDVIIESFEVTFDPNVVDEFGDSIFIEDVVNRYSKYIRVEINRESLNEWMANGTVEVEVGDSVTPIHLFHGSEGSIVNVDITTGRRTINSTVAIQTLSDGYSGLLTNPITFQLEDKVLDTDEIYFPLVYDGGYPTQVKNSIVSLVEDYRLDGVAILDNGDNVSVAESIVSRNEDHNFNTRYAALFDPYSKIYDVHTGRDVWFSPVYHMANLIPLNDKLYDIWYPTAGFRRATIATIKELRYNPKLSQRDQLYLKQINPIVKFSIGETVWGNLTTQKRPSILQNLSIMRMVLYIKRAIEQFLKFYVFEFNDPMSWNEMNNAIGPFLETIKEGRGLKSYSIEVGATEYEEKRKICHVDIILFPTGVIERIELNLYIK